MIASVGVVASLLISAWQTRELTRQTVINNRIAGTTAMYNGLERLHAVDGFIASQPWMYDHFYGGASVPEEPEQRARVLALANILADAVDYGLMTTELTPVQGFDGWRDFALVMFRTCPALVQTVSEHPAWYPGLSSLWRADSMTAD
ncbi:hypothetical protein [Streptomyces panaciradicis]|uniref:hypothetical protein n=1 Tax=Streptomyces panaciradicis TaxID=1470261 RepID=UPI00201CB61D|nr:hypothetical protein [Streptomyces panaciradicis]MCL6667324.1 hypothetical protein [Streptomyces panaciradicis]